MKNILLTDKDFQTSKWSGGKTTELYLYPKDSSFKDKNFDIRLSTATVEVETSIFTKLPSVSRTLIVLEGEMTLTHQNHHVKKLQKFQFDNFEGDWNTESYGTCVDFNIMTTNGRKSKITPFPLEKWDEITLNSCIEAEASFLYVYKGALDLLIENESQSLLANSLLVLSQCDKLEIKALEKSELLLIEIFK